MKNMKKRLFFPYIKEIIMSYRLYVSILLVGVLFVISRECEFTGSSLIYMSFGSFTQGAMRSVTYVAATFPFIITLCDDLTDQYIRPVVIRSGVKSYTRSKFAAGFLSAFLTLFFGFLLAAWVESFRIPLTDPYNPEVFLLYGCFVESGLPILTLIARAFQYAVGGAVYACLGFVIAVVLTNKFVAMSVPFAVSHVIDIVSVPDGLPAGLNIGEFFIGGYAIGPLDGVIKESEHPGITWINFLYAMSIFTALSVGIYIIFAVLTKKRVNGSL